MTGRLRPPRELLDLTGRVVVVTGAAGGIGAGVARRLSAAGASVVAHTRSSDLAPLVETLTGPSATVAADLSDEGAPAAIVAAALEAFGRLDGLVNNAGLQTLASLADVSEDEWQAMLDTNLTAVHRLTRAAAAAMIGSGSGKSGSGGGSIVHIASIEGRQPAPMHGHYAASKAAVIMHARAAALEFGRQGVRVNSVSPGLIDRDGLAEAWPEGVERWRAAAPLGRLGTPEDIGDACLFLLSPLSRWITGHDLVVDGGVMTHPTW